MSGEYTGERRKLAGRVAAENAMPRGWWSERQETLARLWAAGKSTAEIGAVLGIGKSAVIGRAHRSGLPARPSPLLPKSAAPRLAAPVPRPSRSSRSSQPVEEPSLDQPWIAERDRRASLRRAPEPPPVISVSPYRTCQSVEDPGRYGVGIRYCGAANVPGKSYCDDHCARYFTRHVSGGGGFVFGRSPPDHMRAAAE